MGTALQSQLQQATPFATRTHTLQHPLLSRRQLRRCIARVSTAKAPQPHTARTLHAPSRAATTPAPSSSDADVGPSSSSNQRSSSPAWFLPSSLSGTNQQVLLGLAAAAGVGVFGSGFELDGPASALEALAVLASIIAVHEWGHFTAARAQGIHVTQFAIGFGPPLISFKVSLAWMDAWLCCV